MTEVIMPKMGDGMEEGTLLEWIKKDGDKVKSGEVIGSIQTDKATLEFEATTSGILTGFLIQPGETVPVGTVIGAILKDGESLPADWGKGGSSSGAAAEAPATTSAPEAAPVAAASNSVTEDVRVKASPLAKKIAADKGIDLRTVIGSGPGGRIVQKDLEGVAGGSAPAPAAAAAAPSSAPAAKAPAAPAINFTPGEDQVIQLNRIRQITAKRTQESKSQVPHFYVTVEVDVEKILELRRMFEEEESGKVSINDFVVKASALALRDMPEVNASFQGTTLLAHGGVHIGIAVALPDGLTVPVVHNADQKSLRFISDEVRSLAKGARDGNLGLDKLSGSTFAISNMGMLDVDNFLAIVNQPNSAILAIASVRKKVVVNDQDEIEIRNRMNITCSCDHRVMDGAVGAKFINAIKGYLENPTRLLS